MLTQSREKFQEILKVAENLYRQSPDWVTFFRQILGVEGIMRRSFPALDQLNEFEQSEEYEKIQKMLVKLREKRIEIDETEEPTKVITVRLPKSMHDSLRTEAHDLKTSMNKLCISKLLLLIDEEMIPNDRASNAATASRSTKGAAQPTSDAPALADANGASMPAASQQPVDRDAEMGRLAAASINQPLRNQTPPTQGSQSAMTPPPFKPSQPRF